VAHRSKHPLFAVTADVVALSIRDDDLVVLLVRRRRPPYKGRLALPGGFVGIEESVEEAARRELVEETGVDLADAHLEQLATYGEPKRDPRMRTVTVAWLAIVPDAREPTAGSDAASALWLPVTEVVGRPRRLAFDHHQILTDGLARAQSRLEYSAIGRAFCAPEFTIGELRRVYEIVWGELLDPGNFHRKVTGTPGFVVATRRRTTRGGGRPAALYRSGPADALHPPLTHASLR
jgi:8-oxo-dGTP diphosphatase